MKSKLVYIVNDNLQYADLLERELNNHGFSNIKRFNSGEHCLNEIAHEPYMVLIDQLLPDMEGAYLINRIKEEIVKTHAILLTDNKILGREIMKAMRKGTRVILKHEDDTMDMLNENFMALRN